MDVTIQNETGSPAAVSLSKSTNWQIADIAGQIGSLLPGIGAVADVSEVVKAINIASLMRGASSAYQEIPRILGSAKGCILLPPGGKGGVFEPMSIGDLFSPSWWNDLFGGTSVTIFVCGREGSRLGAVSFSISGIASTKLTISAKGVREGIGNPNGHLHRWGEGGTYSGFNTDTEPALITYRGKYHLFFGDRGGRAIMHAVSDNGLQWTAADPQNVGFDTSAAPCPVTDGRVVALVFRDGASGANGILHVRSSDGLHFYRPDDWYIGLNCDGKPSAVSFDDGGLSIVARDYGGEHGVMYGGLRGGEGWSHLYTGWAHGYTGFNTSGIPAAVVFGGNVHAFFTELGGDGIVHIVSNDGLSWSAANPFSIGARTSGSLFAVVHRDRVLVLFRDPGGNGILAVQSEDGYNFAPVPDSYIGVNCDGGPTAAVLGDQLCVAGRDPDGNGIMCGIPDLAP